MGAQALSGRGDRAGAARCAAAGVARSPRPGCACRRRGTSSALLTRKPGACALPLPPHAAQPRQLHHLSRAADALAGAEGGGARSGRLPRLRGRGSARHCRRGRRGRAASATWGSGRTASRAPTTPPASEVRAPHHGGRGRRARRLAKQLIRRFGLDARSLPATYGLGMKELWQLPAGRVRPGLIQHTLGWPLDSRTYGGSFIYHLDNDRVYVGFVVGLDYEDPRLTPFEAFQQFKHHPEVKALLEGGEILSAGARTIAAGGWQSIPRLEMPGAMLIGDCGRRRQRAQDQGRAPGDPLGHAGGASTWRKPASPRWLRRPLARLAWRPGAARGAQLQARVQARPLGRPRQRRPRGAAGRTYALDPLRSHTRSRAAQTAGRVREPGPWLGGAHPAAAGPRSLRCSSPPPATMRASRRT